MSELEEMLDNLDMESYLDYEGIDYKHTHGSHGPQLNLKTCPSCGHDDWKVFMNEETGLGNCFHGSCEMGTFNKWKFVSNVLGLDSKREIFQHLKHVSSQLGWRPKKVAKRVTRQASMVLPVSVALPDSNGSNLAYLEDRGVTSDIASYFGLRFCVSGGFTYSINDRKVTQDYSSRVIIPIADISGEVATFQGRDITGDAEKKYLFPPGLAATGSILYNSFNAIGAEEIAVGEGVFDAIGIHRAFEEDINMRHIFPVASFGMHISKTDDNNSDQFSSFVKLQSKGLKRVTFMWDGEAKTIPPVRTAAKMLRAIGLSVRVATLPPGKDPSDMEGEELRRAYYQAADLDTPLGQKKLMAIAMAAR